MPGDDGYEAEGEEEDEGAKKEGSPSKEEEQRAREDKFGEWWRARLVSEFEGDLGGLAAASLDGTCPLGVRFAGADSLLFTIHRNPGSLLLDSPSFSLPSPPSPPCTPRPAPPSPPTLGPSGSTIPLLPSTLSPPLNKRRVSRSGASLPSEERAMLKLARKESGWMRRM